ncbi:hypothetical protein [Streptomyces sp. NPDC088196]|uniref:hypothetical protein n=1 Tax=Streptomyces sp. NPDC088196 TaxID=3154868 RepID=UPI00344F7D71
MLFTGVDEVVHYGKEFTHSEQHQDGTVTAHFADGTTATGNVLVAADGTRSAVRRQHLPHAEIKDAGITAIATKTALTPKTRVLLSDSSTSQGSRPGTGIPTCAGSSNSPTPRPRSRSGSPPRSPSAPGRPPPSPCSATPSTR